MDTDIIEVTCYLRRHEKHIINGSSKLSLTACLLNKINVSLQEAEYNKIVLTRSLKNEVYQSLCGIISKIPKLVITQKIRSDKWRVDISRFENLQHLELNNVPIYVVEGIQSLRHQLRVLICDNVSESIDDILGCSDYWEQLHTAKLCYNGFGPSLKLCNVPWLQYLDLSHNRLQGKMEFQTLTNLKHLNLSFNCLTSLPVLSEYAYHLLTVIHLNNNFIEDLSNIHLFSALETLDVSYNILADHAMLSSVVFLSNLRSINLSNNPISFHPYHRIYTCCHVNGSANLNEFLLDGRQLNTLEKKEIIRLSSCVSDVYLQHENKLYSGILNQSVVRTIPSRKVRDVVIKNGSTDSSQKSSSSSTETNEFRSTIKNEFGEPRGRFRADPWFYSNSITRVHCFLNIERIVSTYNQDMLSPLPKSPGTLMTFQKTINQPDASGLNINTTALLVKHCENIYRDEDILLYLENYDRLHQDLLAVDIKPDSLNSTFEKQAIVANLEDEENQICMNTTEVINEDTYVTDDESTSSEESFDELLLAQKKSQDGNSLYVFVALGESDIREKSIITGNTLITWSLRSVESCEKLTTNPSTIRLVFNKVRRESRERIYVMEHFDADKLMKKVRLFLDARSLSSMNQLVYRCLKCNSIFSQEFQKKVLPPITVFGTEISEYKSTVKCFTCSSTLVVIEEDMLHSRCETDNLLITQRFLSCSPTKAPTPKKTLVMESGEVRGDTMITCLSSTFTVYDSDIEIISNPSQSSIEVLEVQTQDHLLSDSLFREISKGNQSDECSLKKAQYIGEPDKPANLLAKPISTESVSSDKLVSNNAVEINKYNEVEVEEMPILNIYSSLLEGFIYSATTRFSPINWTR